MRIHVIWLGLLGLGAAACGGDTIEPLEASGTVEATEADLGFQVAGRIDSVFVREGDRVVAGQRLAVLDREELEARRSAAEAQRRAQAARLAELRAGFRPEEIAQARAQLRVAEARVTDALRERDRARNLQAGGALSQQGLERAELAWSTAVGERDRAAEALGLFEAGPRSEQIAAQEAQVAQAAAAVAQADAGLRMAVVEAPFAGVISRRHREPGEVVGAGMPVLSLQDLEDRWVRIYLREAVLGRVGIGQAAVLVINAFPDRQYRGEVTAIADQAEFTPRNVQTREERVKLVYRIRVRVVGDTAVDLKPGLSADVSLVERP